MNLCVRYGDPLLICAGLRVAGHEHGLRLRLGLRVRLAPKSEQNGIYQAIGGQDSERHPEENRKGENYRSVKSVHGSAPKSAPHSDAGFMPFVSCG